MKLCIASYAFHGLVRDGLMDVFHYFESCRYRYELAAADIWSGMVAGLDQAYLAKIREGLASRELELANLCVDGPHIWEDDPAQRERNHQAALEWLQAAQYLGARTIRIDAGGKGDVFSDEQFDLIVRRYREYARIAGDHGFRMGPENHWGPEVVPETMRRICQAVDDPAFGVLLHFRGNAGDALMAPWAMHTHISWDITLNSLEASLTVLRDAGYQGYYSVEHHSGQSEYTKVEIQVALIRDLLSRW